VLALQRTKLRFKMERFFNNDDEDNVPEFEFKDDTFEEYEEDTEAIAYIDKQDLLEVMHMDLAQTELANDVMSKAIGVAEKSIFWRFRSADYKMKQIELIYIRLMQITSGSHEEEDEGEDDATL